MENPILNQGQLPNFSQIVPEQIESTLKQVLAENRSTLNNLLSNANSSFTWENLMQPLEDMEDKLSKLWSPIGHLHSVMETDTLRAAYNACLPLLTEYHTDLLQNETLFKAIQSIADGSDFANLSPQQQKVIENELRDFRLAGVHLAPEAKARFAELQQQLNAFTTQFAENLIDATDGWTLHVTELESLKGLPEHTLLLAEQNAKQRNQTGWIFTLDYPCYSTVMKYLENRELRWLMYEAYVTRASDQGPQAGKQDNTAIIDNILKTRHAIATLLGFKNYAEYSLSTKMAKTEKQVITFLNDLVARAKPFAQQEFEELSTFAKSIDPIEKLEAWDLAYYTEKLRQTKYDLGQEELKPYFAADKVLEGMFIVMGLVLGIKIIEKQGIDTWHPHVQFFEVYDAENNLRGYFYTDLYARPHKRDGAWMDEARTRRRLADGSIQLPVAFLTCNFTRPLGDKPALLTHDDVQTVFHEFGHCLHHLLTQMEYSGISGINGVPWDAIEFPSQFFENWCWNKDAINYISSHETTNEPLPPALFSKLYAAKNFQAGMQMLRQLEFSLFDFRIHQEFDTNQSSQVQPILDNVREQVSVLPTPKFNRFQHSFSHIFAGGYAAGYYSYKWAEVLSSDAFSLFEEQGIFNRQVGMSFLHNILEQGGLTDPMTLFVTFRGHEPQVDSLLRQNGLEMTNNQTAGKAS